MYRVDSAELIHQVRKRPAIWYQNEDHAICKRNAWREICEHFYPRIFLYDEQLKEQVWVSLQAQWEELVVEFFRESQHRLGVRGVSQLSSPFFGEMSFLLSASTGSPSGETKTAGEGSRETDDSDQHFLRSLIPKYEQVPENLKAYLHSDVLDLLSRYKSKQCHPPRFNH